MPDHTNTTVINGITVRKGTAAAFLHNAGEWTEPATPALHRAELERLMVADLPALRAIGLFTVMAVRDERLAAFLGAHLDER